MWWWPDLDRWWPTTHDPVVAQAGAGGSSCVPVSKAPLLRRAGLSGCIKPVRLGVMIMVASSKDHGLMRQTSWDHTQLSSDLLQVEVLEWRTPPCTVGDSERLAPRMRSAGVAAWMRGKGHSKSTWWCAQRGHLQGVQRLVNTVPGADYYLLVDDDTQGAHLNSLRQPAPASAHQAPSTACLLATQFSRAPRACFSRCWSAASYSRTRTFTQGT